MTTDINLAGLGLLSFLTLFFPAIGLVERRRRKMMERQAEESHKAALQALLVAEAERIVAETSAQVQQGIWR